MIHSSKIPRGLPATLRRLNWTAILPDEPTRAKGNSILDSPKITLQFRCYPHLAHRHRRLGAFSGPHSLTSLQPRTSASTSVARCGTRQPTFVRFGELFSNSKSPQVASSRRASLLPLGEEWSKGLASVGSLHAAPWKGHCAY